MERVDLWQAGARVRFLPRVTSFFSRLLGEISLPVLKAGTRIYLWPRKFIVSPVDLLTASVPGAVGSWRTVLKDCVRPPFDVPSWLPSGTKC
jgi:hypothetical protein